MTTNYDIFISYRSADSLPVQVCRKLEEQGLRCWIAPRDIPPGTPYARAIMTGIDVCRYFLVFISTASIKSDDVLNEIDNAHREKKTIIPILCDKVDLPKEFAYYLSRRQWIDLTEGWTSKIPAILSACPRAERPSNPPSESPVDIPNQDKEAFAYILPRAESGDVNAQYGLATMYFNGMGVRCDCDEAIKWLKRAANGGLPAAQYDLGKLYYAGKRVAQNHTEAKRWFSRAADQGYAAAQDSMGDIYFYGRGVGEDFAEAVQWYEQAAAQGYAAAQNNLGNMYYWGKGVEQNYAEAVRCYKQAAVQGYPDAQYNLADMYYWGKGVPANPSEARNWFRKAAAQGYKRAQDSLKRYFNE